MGQILGLGITHVPNLAAQVNMSVRFAQRLQDPALPQALRAPENCGATIRGRRIRTGIART
jgi:hypothetical protein